MAMKIKSELWAPANPVHDHMVHGTFRLASYSRGWGFYGVLQGHCDCYGGKEVGFSDQPGIILATIAFGHHVVHDRLSLDAWDSLPQDIWQPFDMHGPVCGVVKRLQALYTPGLGAGVSTSGHMSAW